MELLPNTLITEDDFALSDELPLIDGWQDCPPGWHEFEVNMDPLSFGDDSFLYLQRDGDIESIPLGSQRSSLVYSSQPFQLKYRPPHPQTTSSYTLHTLSLLPIDGHELARRFELCLFGDRGKALALMQLERDEDRWKALRNYVAHDVFDCAELGIQIEHPRDFSWEGDGLIRSHTYQPHFLVSPSDRSTFANLMRCRIEGGSGSAMLLPKIYVSDTRGAFSEKMGIRFPALIEQMSSERLIHVPRGARIRVNPVSGPGTARITGMSFESATVFNLIAKTATSVLSGGYREIPSIVREIAQTRMDHAANTARRGITRKFWLLYRRLNRALSSRELPSNPHTQDVVTWLKDFQPSPAVLNGYRAAVKSLDLNTKFSIVCPLHQARDKRLDELIQSVLEQIYGEWELLLIEDGADAMREQRFGKGGGTDARIRYIENDKNHGISASLNVAVRHARGDYLIFVTADDVLENHALYRCASAICSEKADFLYSDESLAGENIVDTIGVTTRPSFSIDYYLSYPYFVHLVCVRRTLAQSAGLFDESLHFGQVVDFNLRCLELAQVVTHIPDYLYRRRSHAESTDQSEEAWKNASMIAVIESHLTRTDRDATVRETQHFNVFDVRDPVPKNARVAAIIPTKNNHQLLRKAVDSCIEKRGNVEVDVFVIDHESDEEETRDYLASLEARSIATVIPYEGTFNFSKINNLAVSKLPPGIAYYLFLNNDVEAITDGWIESMTATCSRADVGVCGAMLLYPDNTIQHGGVTIGFLGAAEHTYKSQPYYDAAGTPSIKHARALVARRDCMAVTAAAMMVRADVFHESGGYDEQLEVGFNDTDLCLRIFEKGYKVIFDSNVVLYHFESATRGTGASDPHPDDTERFRNKHRSWIEKKELFYGAQLSLASTDLTLDPNARSQFSRPRTIFQPDGCYGKRLLKL